MRVIKSSPLTFILRLKVTLSYKFSEFVQVRDAEVVGFTKRVLLFQSVPWYFKWTNMGKHCLQTMDSFNGERIVTFVLIFNSCGVLCASHMRVIGVKQMHEGCSWYPVNTEKSLCSLLIYCTLNTICRRIIYSLLYFSSYGRVAGNFYEMIRKRSTA